MPNPPSKPQLAIYAALAIAVLLIGARFLREGGGATAADAGSAGSAFTSSSGGAGSGVTGGTATSGDAGGSLPDGAATGAAAAAGRLVVDVKGAVRRPGVYRLADGARALDAVHRAGGLTRGADRIHVNLAARVVDGGEVVVPERGASGSTATASPPAGAGSDAGASASAGAPLALDVNTATEAELEQLDGVGPATAAKIVAYRTQNGGFASIDDLDKVSGIGPAKLAAIRAQLGR